MMHGQQNVKKKFLVYCHGYYYYYYYYYYVIIAVACHRPFLTGTVPLEPTAIPTAQTSVSHCSTFRIMCDVPTIAVCCSESIECVPGTAFKTFFRPFVAIPMAAIITGIITHFMIHIRCISIHKL
jgi:hypothetical protein